MTRARGPSSATAGARVRALVAVGVPLTVVAAGCGSSPMPEDAALTDDAARLPTDDAFVTSVDAGAADAPSIDAAGPDAFVMRETIEIAPPYSESTGAIGELDVPVEITDQRSFMVVANNAESAARVSVLSITDPSGTVVFRWQDWYDRTERLTNAIFAERTGTTIHWPIREEDPALVPGTYLVRVGSYRIDGVTSRPNVDLDITTITNRDHELSRGAVRVAIVWADGLSADAALVSATARAVEHWNDVWGAVGLTAEVRYVESTIDPALPAPSAMSGDVLLTASGLVEPGEIAMIVGETVDGGTSLYGIAGHIPGPIVPSPLGAIVVGWLANAGGDGTFSDDDITLYGEVLAHEVGHFVGLCHPVERSYDYWDALDDTPQCTSARTCESVLGMNLMFPYSICDGGTCVSTMEITPGQQGIMQRYTGTR